MYIKQNEKQMEWALLTFLLSKKRRERELAVKKIRWLLRYRLYLMLF